MDDLVLCRPTGPCTRHNECYRYRALHNGAQRIHDFTDRPDGAARCWGWMPIYDSDDDLMPNDWQESKVGGPVAGTGED